MDTATTAMRGLVAGWLERGTAHLGVSILRVESIANDDTFDLLDREGCFFVASNHLALAVFLGG